MTRKVKQWFVFLAVLVAVSMFNPHSVEAACDKQGLLKTPEAQLHWGYIRDEGWAKGNNCESAASVGYPQYIALRKNFKTQAKAFGCNVTTFSTDMRQPAWMRMNNDASDNDLRVYYNVTAMCKYMPETEWALQNTGKADDERPPEPAKCDGDKMSVIRDGNAILRSLLACHDRMWNECDPNVITPANWARLQKTFDESPCDMKDFMASGALSDRVYDSWPTVKAKFCPLGEINPPCGEPKAEPPAPKPEDVLASPEPQPQPPPAEPEPEPARDTSRCNVNELNSTFAGHWAAKVREERAKPCASVDMSWFTEARRASVIGNFGDHCDWDVFDGLTDVRTPADTGCTAGGQPSPLPNPIEIREPAEPIVAPSVPAGMEVHGVLSLGANFFSNGTSVPFEGNEFRLQLAGEFSTGAMHRYVARLGFAFTTGQTFAASPESAGVWSGTTDMGLVLVPAGYALRFPTVNFIELMALAELVIPFTQSGVDVGGRVSARLFNLVDVYIGGGFSHRADGMATGAAQTASGVLYPDYLGDTRQRNAALLTFGLDLAPLIWGVTESGSGS